MQNMVAGTPDEHLKQCTYCPRHVVRIVISLNEAAELVSENEEIIREVEKVVEFIGLELVIFELPGPWISGINSQDVHQMRRKLIDLYGFEVNLGNVMPEDLMSLEAYRKGLGVNAGKGKMDKDRD